MATAKKSLMNSKVIIIIVVILLLLGVGAFIMMGKNKSSDGLMSTGTNAFTSIKDALSKSLSLECEFTDSEGRVSKVAIKNGAMRGDFTGATTEESGSVITRDKKMYFWNGKEGFMMDVPEETGDNSIDTDSKTGQGQNFLKEIEQYKDSCKPAIVSDSLFTPPADVTFQDMSKMMESIPSGSAIPEGSGMTEEDLKKMMEQYQTEE